jgi:phosphoribosylglycinamide formyltransferase-1
MMEETGIHLAIFVYNFPHKKTQDFLFRLYTDRIIPQLVLAADPIKLGIPAPSIRVKPRHIDLIHPKIICNTLNIEYLVVDHNCDRCCDVLRTSNIDIAVIAGARILKEPVISSVRKGIINIHPGLLPEGRGMDALQWAIYENRPLGVTSHVINKKVDHGLIIKKEAIPEYKDDTFIDLSLRLEQTQTNIVSESVNILRHTDTSALEPVGDKYPLHRKMPKELEECLPDLLLKRKGRE